MLPGQLCCLWGSWWGFLQWQQQHDHSAAAPALNPLTCSAQPLDVSGSSASFQFCSTTPKGILKNLADDFQNIFFYFGEMPGVILRTWMDQSPTCWSAPCSCCESMSCALASCSKTNLVDFHNYYNLIMNPSVWTVHRTACQRSHASHCEMQQDCVPSEKVLRWDETLCCITGKYVYQLWLIDVSSAPWQNHDGM